MIIKLIDEQTVPGGLAVVLCDEDGEPLAMQKRAVLSQEIGRPSTLSVTFVIDGDRVRFEA